MSEEIEIEWPSQVELDDGSVLDLPENELFLKNLYCTVESKIVDEIARKLMNVGFRRVIAFPTGEKYSIARSVGEYFEHHIRIFTNGTILSEVEISRKYVEHVLLPSFNASLLTFKILRDLGFEPSLVYRGIRIVRVLKIVKYCIKLDMQLHRVGSIFLEFIRGLVSSLMHNFSLSND